MKGNMLLKENIVLFTIPEYGHLIPCLGFLNRYANAKNITVFIPENESKRAISVLESNYPKLQVQLKELSKTQFVHTGDMRPFTIFRHYESTLTYAHKIKEWFYRNTVNTSTTTIIIDSILEYALDKDLLKKFSDIRTIHAASPLTIPGIFHFKIPLSHILGKFQSWPKNFFKAIKLFLWNNKNHHQKIHLWDIANKYSIERYIFAPETVLNCFPNIHRKLKITALPVLTERQEIIPPLLSEFLQKFPRVTYLSLGTLFEQNTHIYKKLLVDVQKEEPLIIACTQEKIPELKELTKEWDKVYLGTNLPQLHILQHAKLFITHGGSSSTVEAIHFQVPMKILPTMFEHEVFAKIAKQLHCGEIVTL